MYKILPRPCSICSRRLARIESDAPSIGLVQRRGKKKTTRGPPTLPVRLLEDLEGYGRKGSVVPMSVGPMRNYYFPERVADYLPFPQLRELKRNKVPIERDYTFGTGVEDEGAEMKDEAVTVVDGIGKPTRRNRPVRVEIELFSPSEAFSALDQLIPPSIVFYRSPIPSSDHVKVKHAPSPAILDASSPGSPGIASDVPPTLIYGSVSAADIATNLKALINASAETAGRVALADSDIRLLTGVDLEDKQRIKRLGNFEFEVKIKGHDRNIRRQLRVLEESEALVDPAIADQVVEELAGQNPIKGAATDDVLEVQAAAETLERDVTELVGEGRDLLQNTRLATEDPVEFTPAEKEEIELRGDVVPDLVETEGLIDMDNEERSLKDRQPKGGKV